MDRSGLAHASCGGEAREGEERGADHTGGWSAPSRRWCTRCAPRHRRRSECEHRHGRQVGVLINWYLVGKDGKTALERQKGKGFKTVGHWLPRDRHGQATTTTWQTGQAGVDVGEGYSCRLSLTVRRVHGHRRGRRVQDKNHLLIPGGGTLGPRGHRGSSPRG